METVVRRPGTEGVWGETVYVDKALQWVPPPKEGKKKEEKPKEEKQKEKAKPKVVEEEYEEEEEEEPLVPEEPKAKNPLDSLPKSTFNLEEWKRVYSNNETRGAGGALEWFYKKCVFF
jgi:elongation factor 1-gamma